MVNCEHEFETELASTDSQTFETDFVQTQSEFDVEYNSFQVGGTSGGGVDMENVLLKIEQVLTEEELDQVRANLKFVGKNVEGNTYYPYTVNEDNDYEYIYDDPVTAAAGAEIQNDYANNFAAGAWSTAMGYMTQAVGNYSFTNGWWTRADGQCSVASGLLSRASGHFTHAEGTRTVASINNAHSEGDMTQATGRQSHSEGQSTISSGFCSHSEGSATTSSGYYSHAEGWGTIAKGKNQTAMGKYNIGDTSSLLIVGKGSKTTASNALTLNSSGNLWVAGTMTSAGADYAEFFEWIDGNPNAEDRIGMVVALDGEKIRPANSDDDVLGVVSGTAMVLGDNAAYEWKDKYVTDVYGRIVCDEPVEEFAEYIDHETGEVVKESTGFSVYPKMNPSFDPNQEYISRADRKEWDVIGLLGKLHVNDDGTCAVNGFAKVGADGILTASEEKTNIRVMKRVFDSVVLVMLK